MGVRHAERVRRTREPVPHPIKTPVEGRSMQPKRRTRHSTRRTRDFASRRGTRTVRTQLSRRMRTATRCSSGSQCSQRWRHDRTRRRRRARSCARDCRCGRDRCADHQPSGQYRDNSATCSTSHQPFPRLAPTVRCREGPRGTRNDSPRQPVPPRLTQRPHPSSGASATQGSTVQPSAECLPHLLPSVDRPRPGQ